MTKNAQTVARHLTTFNKDKFIIKFTSINQNYNKNAKNTAKTVFFLKNTNTMRLKLFDCFFLFLYSFFAEIIAQYSQRIENCQQSYADISKDSKEHTLAYHSTKF